MREGQRIPHDVERPEEEEEGKEEQEKGEKKGEKEKEKEKEEEEEEEQQEERVEEKKGEKRKRGRRAGKANKKKNTEEGEQQLIRNREGRTRYEQAKKTGERVVQDWTKEEEDREWQLKEVVQEIELKGGGGRQYRMQYEGFSKMSDTRWYDEEIARSEEWKELMKEWERKKRIYGVTKKDGKDGRVTKIARVVKEKKKSTARVTKKKRRTLHV